MYSYLILNTSRRHSPSPCREYPSCVGPYVRFVSRLVTVVVTIRCHRFGASHVAHSVSSSSYLSSVECRKRVVRGCQDPHYDAMFQRPYVSDIDPYLVRSVSIRSSRRSESLCHTDKGFCATAYNSIWHVRVIQACT